MHQSDRQPDNWRVQIDGQARDCQAGYSYKFNERADSREFVAPAQRSLCTQMLTG